MKPIRFTVLALFLLLVSPLHAQPISSTDDYLTVTALAQTVVPAANAVDLAHRFRGLEAIPTPPVKPASPKAGDEQLFWVTDTDANRELQISATLRVIGQHIYMWVQSDVNIEIGEIQRLADAFDTRVYPQVRALWGEEASPGIDGDTRLYGLFARHLGNSVAAYFTSRNVFPKAVWPTSNEHEMFLFNLDTLGTQNLADTEIESVVAHEFQHMIRYNLERNEDIWLNEGFSTFTQLLLYQDAGSIRSFLNNPDTQLNDWPPNADTGPHYGAANLFVAYFYERFGEAGLRQLSNEQGRGLDTFDRVLHQMGQADVNTLFADWVVTNSVFSPQGDDIQYSHPLLSKDYGTASPITNTNEYPFSYTGTLNQYATDYHVFSNFGDKQVIDIHVDAPTIAKLIPFDAPSGQWMWYSNRGDQSDMTLSQAFDLTQVTTASLQYKVWYDTEAFYDYGYVTVSSDGGEHWQILQAPSSDTTNPVNGAYGPGYTGTSEGWRDETVSLDPFAGQKILVRFEFIGDDSTTSRGMAIDDVRIPQIGYQSDFENDGGGWQAEGWLRTDNRLPQQVWVQAIQRTGKQVDVQRWLVPNERDWQLPIKVGADNVVIAISPFAPVTNIPMDYTVTVRPENN